MSIYSRLDRIAADVEKLNRQVKSVSNAPQSQRTSVEGGSIDFNDADGNLQAIVGGQDDGSTTVRHVDGPTPPIPSGLSAHVDGPIIQVTWGGTFEDADSATFDWSHLEVVAVGPSNEQLRGTISDVTGASTSLAATVSGEWTVVARSVSRAEKRSLDGDAGTVEVKLVDIDGAIEAVQDSANGKNKVTYSEHAPTPADPGIFDDTWFVGQVGRPNDIVEATNLATNPKFSDGLIEQLGGRNGPGAYGGIIQAGGGAVLSIEDGWIKVAGAVPSGTAYVVDSRNFWADRYQGKTFTVSATLRLDEKQTGSVHSLARRLDFGVRRAAGYEYSIATSEQAANAPGEYRLSVTCEIPNDALAWFVRFVTGSAEVATYWTDVQVEEGSAASPYFDGDTPSGETNNESHYRWTGTPHASTSEKFLPALDIGESDSWNVIEQYRHDGTGWVKVELSHYVFSTVDLGKATVGELDGIRIQARTMSSEVFEGNAFNGYVFTGSIFRTTNGSEFSDNGLFMYDQDGTPRIQAPVDGSDFTINAEIIARSMTAVGRASFLSDNNRLEPGAGLVLASGVGDPPSPPVVSTYYPQIKAPLQDTDRGAYGLAWADGHFWRWVENSNTSGNRGRVEKISTDGDIVASFDTGDFLARNGVVGIGSELFLLGPKTGNNDRRWVQVYGLDGSFKREWQYTFHVSTSKHQPGIGRDEAGSLIVAHCWSDTGKLTWRTFNKTTGALTSTFDSPDKTRADINSIYVGEADFGVKRATVSKVTGSSGFEEFVVLNATTGVYVPDESWRAPGSGDTGGLAWDGEKFHTISQSGTISEFSTPNTGDSGGADWWAVYRWAKDVDEDLTIDLASRISPPARFQWPRRARLRVTAPNLPQAAGEIAPSLAYKSTTPTRTDFRSPSWWSVAGEPSAMYYELPADWQSASTPTDSNNFPDGAPSSLTAASGLFEVKGDGSGHWGPLTFNTDGTMSSSQVPTWVPITTFPSGYSAQTWGDVPSYRIWPDGKVEWRGVIAGAIGPGGNSFPILTIPSGARPGRPKNKAAACSGSGVLRVEFGPTSDVTKLYVYPDAGTRTWVSIDELYYYLP